MVQELTDPSDAIPNATRTALNALGDAPGAGTPLVVRELDPSALQTLVGSLSVSARTAVGVADALRRELGTHDEVHVEHLMSALYADAGHQTATFEAASISVDVFRERMAALELRLPAVTPTSGSAMRPALVLPAARPIATMPPLSEHAALALSAAAAVVGWVPDDAPQAGRITAPVLLAGVLGVRDCHVAQAFDAERGIIGTQIISAIATEVSSRAISLESARSRTRAVEALLGEPPRTTFERLTPAPPAPPAPAAPAAPAPDDANRARSGTGGGAANDQAEGDDRLNFSHYVQAFANLIDSPDTRPPLTIGIFGAWGSGKSFLLRHLTDEIARRASALRPSRRTQFARWLRDTFVRKEKPVTRAYVYSVSFNAWEYNAADHIWPRLVRRVLDSVTRNAQWTPTGWMRQVGRKFRRNFTRKLRADWKSLLAMLVVGAGLWWGFEHLRPAAAETFAERAFGIDLADDKFSVPALVGAIAAALKLIVDTVFTPLGGWVTALLDDGPGYGAESDFVRAVRADLDLVDRQLAAEGSRILITIDDLDRCEPNKAVEVLQAINQLLDRRSFVVVLGIDARVVTAAVEKHYEELLGPAGVTGYEYLDKIIQIPFRIPEPTGDELALFVSKQLGDPTPERSGGGGGVPGRATTPGAAPAARAPAPRLSLDALRKLVRTANPDLAAGTPRSKPIDLPDEVVDSLAGTAHETLDGVNAVLGAVAPGTGFVLGQTVDVVAELLRQPPAPPVAFSFTHDELEAFRAVATVLRPNPRHVKRLVNVYALVRSLAELAKNRTILDDPAATVRWLTLCAQWPYATRTMLVHLDTYGAPDASDPTPPLQWLHQAIAPSLDPAKCIRFDHEPLALRRLVESSEALSWDELRVLRAYTVNFNPALDAELRVAASPRTRRRARSAEHGADRAPRGPAA